MRLLLSYDFQIFGRGKNDIKNTKEIPKNTKEIGPYHIFKKKGVWGDTVPGLFNPRTCTHKCERSDRKLCMKIINYQFYT